MLAILYSHVREVGQVRVKLGRITRAADHRRPGHPRTSAARRLVSAAVLAGAALLAISGCAKVDLVNEWPAMAAPTGWEPKAEVCSSTYAETSYRSAYSPLACTGAHSYETVHIGKFTGEAAALPKPPADGSTAMSAAWAECDTKTTEYLG